MKRAFAGAMVLALAAAGASSTSRTDDDERIAWERAGAAIAAAETRHITNFGSENRS